jgi:DNA-binding GntR family transcriptional regulator
VEDGVSPLSVRKALEKLMNSGAMRIVQGSVIDINPVINSSPLMYHSITEKKFTDINVKMPELR